MKSFSEIVAEFLAIDWAAACVVVLALVWQRILDFVSLPARRIGLGLWMVRMLIGNALAIRNRTWNKTDASKGVLRFCLWVSAFSLTQYIRPAGPIEAGVATVVEAKIIVIEFIGIFKLLGLKDVLPTVAEKKISGQLDDVKAEQEASRARQIEVSHKLDDIAITTSQIGVSSESTNASSILQGLEQARQGMEQASQGSEQKSQGLQQATQGIEQAKQGMTQKTAAQDRAANQVAIEEHLDKLGEKQ